MDPNTPDNRTVTQHLSNLECALFSKVEPVTAETKIYAVQVVREKVWSFLGCDDEFFIIERIVRITGDCELSPLMHDRLTDLMSTLKAKAASLTD